MNGVMRLLFTSFFFAFLLIESAAQPASREFPEDPKEFLAQFEAFVTANKIVAVKNVSDEFLALVKTGLITPEDLAILRTAANQMLGRNLSASPYFSEYLQSLVQLKNRASPTPYSLNGTNCSRGSWKAPTTRQSPISNS